MNLFVYNDGSPNQFDALYSAGSCGSVHNAVLGSQKRTDKSENEKLAQEICARSRECYERAAAYKKKAAGLLLGLGGVGALMGGIPFGGSGTAVGGVAGLTLAKLAARLIPSHHKDIYRKGGSMTVRGLPIDWFPAFGAPSWDEVYKGVFKAANVLSDRGISPRRALRGTVILPTKDRGYAFAATADAVLVRRSDLQSDPVNTIVHELIHRFEDSPAGLYYRQFMTDKFWKDSAYDSESGAHVYKTLHDDKITPYGTTDSRAGFPVEFSTTTLDGLLGTILFPGTAGEFKRPYNEKAMGLVDKTFKQVAEQYGIAEPDLAQEALPITSYSAEAIKQSVTHTQKAIKNLVQRKQILENKLALFQNIAIAHLAHKTRPSNQKQDKSDWDIVQRNYKKGKVPVPKVFSNPEATEEELSSLVGRVIPRKPNLFEQRINRYEPPSVVPLPPVTWRDID